MKGPVPVGKALRSTAAFIHKGDKFKIGPAITQAINGWINSFTKLIPHASLFLDFGFCTKNKPIETKAQGLAAAAKKEIVRPTGSYKTKSVVDQSKPTIGASNKGFEKRDLSTLKNISWVFLCESVPISIKTVERANKPKTKNVEITAGAKPSCPKANTHKGIPMYPVLE